MGNEVLATPLDPGDSAFGDVQGIDPHALVADAQTVKLVVRVTGTGDLMVHLSDPHGNAHPLDWGPEAHISSTYDRPGDEWGMGFSFDQPGCWELALVRDSGTVASFWFAVSSE